MRNLLIATATLALSVGLSPPAHAAPTCTGTTQTLVTSPSTLQDSFLVDAAGQSTGNCVAVGDKLFGNFTFGIGTGLPNTNQITEFDWPVASPFIGNYQIAFSTNLQSGQSVIGFGYEVMVTDPTIALIDNLQKDAAFNGVTGSSILLAGSVNGGQVLACSRTLGGVQDCPIEATFGPFADIIVRQAISTAGGAILTNVTDTISQVPAAVPEPSSLALLGVGLLGAGLVIRSHRRQRQGGIATFAAEAAGQVPISGALRIMTPKSTMI